MNDSVNSELGRHRETVDLAIRSSELEWTDWPALAADAPFSEDTRLSCLLLLLSSPVGMSIDTTVDRLRRRTLPWDASTATLALRIVARLEKFDGQRAGVALRAAEQICLKGAATQQLLQSVKDLRSVLELIPGPVAGLGRMDYWQMPETLALIERVLAAATPPDILDLSIIRDGDGWGVPAREAALRFPSGEIAPLVRLLTSLGPAKPGKSWRKKVAEELTHTSPSLLLTEWLKLASDTDIVAPDEHAVLGFAGAMLFAHGNDDLVRASVFAAQELSNDQLGSGVLGVLARRGAASSGVPGMTGALALSVASAALESLAGRLTENDRAELNELFEDLTRRDMVRRIAKYLGLSQERVEQRDKLLRRSKAGAVRAKADPAQRRARAAMDAIIRSQFAPILKARGFKPTGRTFRRVSSDRVDVVAIGSFGMNQFAWSYGTRFVTTWPPREPADINEAGLDIRLVEESGISPTDVRLAADKLDGTILPFLDSLGSYELVRAYVEHNTGAPAESRCIAGRGTPIAFLGLWALSVGDRATAMKVLRTAIDFREALTLSNSFYANELEHWKVSFEAATALPEDSNW
ncbi:DUF4304 domain-containing protein [Arthrobacter sp. YN]|uniref:DUF4304 domain-containing protein n=1 Tax=Arthrobacter sp. YN TaxID=2020486 RepID=UPI000B5EAFC4|nr:DUF4304 domain-containing protein [Arthrobacter sp. YN]ASN19887.1 hypothetical protein CGK93_09530 [Arthrobacter sp. YN]